MHISYSELKTFRQCPRLYECRYVRRLPEKPGRDKLAFWGVVLGAMVERFYRDRWWMDPVMAESDMRRFLSAEAARRTEMKGIAWGPGEFLAGMEKAREAVTKILSTARAEGLIGVDSWVEQEMELQVECDGVEHTVHGRADLVLRAANGQFTLIDGKAGSVLGRRSDPDQLKLYSLMVKRHYGQRPARAGFWWFRHGVVRWKTLTRLPEFAAGLVGTLQRILHAAYAPTAGAHCELCDYWATCPVGQERTAEKTVSGLALVPGQVAVIGI